MRTFDIRVQDPKQQVADVRPFTIVSADSHAGPPSWGYIPYIDPQYREHAERFLADAKMHYEIAGACGYPFGPDVLAIIDDRGLMRNGGEIGAYDPERRIREAEAEGIVAEILHPLGSVNSTPFYDFFNSLYSPELRTAGALAHNRFLEDFCSHAPKRLLGVHCTYPWPDMAAAVHQCEHAKSVGAYAVFPAQQAGVPGDVCPPFYDPVWDPFWAACQDLDLPIHLHAGWGKPQGTILDAFNAILAQVEAAHEQDPTEELVSVTAEAFDTFLERRALWHLMFGGVFDRFPRLKVSFVEIHGDWVPKTLEYLDSVADAYPGLMQLKPSEYWPRHCAVGASLLRATDVAARHAIGIDRIMFGSDFPHMEGTWPNTREWLRTTIASLSEDEARQILGENAIAFYGLDKELLDQVARRVGPFPDSLLGDHAVDPAIVAHLHKRAGIKKPEAALFYDELVASVAADAADAQLVRSRA